RHLEEEIAEDRNGEDARIESHPALFGIEIALEEEGGGTRKEGEQPPITDEEIADEYQNLRIPRQALVEVGKDPGDLGHHNRHHQDEDADGHQHHEARIREGARYLAFQLRLALE